MSSLFKKNTHIVYGSSIRGKLFSVSPWTEIDELTGGMGRSLSYRQARLTDNVTKKAKSFGLFCPHLKTLIAVFFDIQKLGLNDEPL